MKKWRKAHPLTEAQKIKDRARAYANVYLRRGKILRESCRVCGAHAQMHHPDYSKPLYIIWLCRPHHPAIHSFGGDVNNALERVVLLARDGAEIE